MGRRKKGRTADADAPRPPRTALGRAWRAIQSRRWSRWSFDLLLLALVLWGVMAWQARGLVGGGQPAPPLSLGGLDGATHDLADLRGRKVVVEFWAPWCTVCQAQAGNVDAVAGEDVAVLSVALDYADRAAVEAFVREHDVAAPVLLGDATTHRDWKVGSFPTTYIIDEEGRIEHALVGYTTTLGLRARLWF